MAFAKRLFLAVALLLGSTSAAAETPVERHGQLRIDGTRLLDRHGEPVTLRGMSLFWSQWIPRYYNEATLRRLRDEWGITVIRAALAVEHGGYLENPEAEAAKIERVIEAASTLGLYVIVDWHAHQPHPEEAADYFGKLAARYGDRPNIIYETYNEPLPEHGWAAVLKPYHERVVAAIRAHDPDNIVVLGTRSWSQDVDEAAADPVAGTNLAYTLHFYAASHKQPYRDKAQRALDRGIALFVTEYGTTQASGDESIDAAEAQIWWDWMEARGISYANWSIADKDEKSAIFKPGTATDGRWRDSDVTESGRLVRAQLRKMAGID
ncbi:glycoside hydrolase family 5 protein [Sphingopyxis sp.]|jgi:endoglucanase|uniref:glycoside hydrolase family 5 protein n=1 Tax=Sphingopyxis sp. TaxID=1908224 RepID=UPI002DECCF63|nr:glycoside hydrolase family 5 protein [Sphingopyxis sp.]